MHIYCKNCKKHKGNTLQKHVICLTEKTFIQVIEDKYGLEKKKLEIYLQFFTGFFTEEHEDLLCEVLKKY